MRLLLCMVLAGCATEVVEIHECRCAITYVDPIAQVVDSVRYVVFDTLPTNEDCQEAGRRFCPTVE